MTTPLVVRPAHADDRGRVWPLARDLASSYEVDQERFATTFDGLVGAHDALLLIGEIDGRVVGYLLAHHHHTFHANGPAVWVEELMVTDEDRRRGVGTALMKVAEEWAHHHGVAYIALATRRAAQFYTALGYEPSATYFRRSV